MPFLSHAGRYDVGAFVLAVFLGTAVAAAYIQFGPRALIGLVGLLVWPGSHLSRRAQMLSVGGLQVSFDHALDEISAVHPDQTQEVAAAQIRLLTDYYKTVLAQARESFRWALVGVGVGLAFFIAAIAVQLAEGSTNAAAISAISGGVVEVISGINFVLYGKTTAQLAQFHERLDRTQRFMLANSLCEAIIEEHARDEARSALISEISARREPRRRWGPAENLAEPAGHFEES